MSGVSTFLQRMRKAELLELAEEVGFTEYEMLSLLRILATSKLTCDSYDGLKKTEVEVALDSYLKENASAHSDNPRLEAFYRRRSESSPVKKESSILPDAVDSKLRSVRRRVTKAAEDFVAT